MDCDVTGTLPGFVMEFATKVEASSDLLQSVIILGSAARGERCVRRNVEGCDFDLLIELRKSPLISSVRYLLAIRKIRRIHESVSESVRHMLSWNVVLIPRTSIEDSFLMRDLALNGRVLAGQPSYLREEARSRLMKRPPPVWEAQRQLLNRVVELNIARLESVVAASQRSIDSDNASQLDRMQLEIVDRSAKAIIAVIDMHLLRQGRYCPSFRDRLNELDRGGVPSASETKDIERSALLYKLGDEPTVFAEYALSDSGARIDAELVDALRSAGMTDPLIVSHLCKSVEVGLSSRIGNLLSSIRTIGIPRTLVYRYPPIAYAYGVSISLLQNSIANAGNIHRGTFPGNLPVSFVHRIRQRHGVWGTNPSGFDAATMLAMLQYLYLHNPQLLMRLPHKESRN